VASKLAGQPRGGCPHTIPSRRHRQRQSLHRARPGLHHPGTLCPPRLGAAREVLV